MGQEIATIVRGHIDRRLQPILARLDAIEAKLADREPDPAAAVAKAWSADK
ncbi:hypothetical protein [Inquilinus limosus]|uniref:hypothetical protein n=1 Tax=Inquilinus limosus TaxID=171674 RepID=UPI00040C5A5A|nr:hypothetical protein [Inquilinus limosus]